MSIVLRIALIVVSALVRYFVLKKIRKAQLEIDDSIYWIVFSVLLLVISIFPGIAIEASKLLGVRSPANFVFLVMIFLLLILKRRTIWQTVSQKIQQLEKFGLKLQENN